VANDKFCSGYYTTFSYNIRKNRMIACCEVGVAEVRARKVGLHDPQVAFQKQEHVLIVAALVQLATNFYAPDAVICID